FFFFRLIQYSLTFLISFVVILSKECYIANISNVILIVNIYSISIVNILYKTILLHVFRYIIPSDSNSFRDSLLDVVLIFNSFSISVSMIGVPGRILFDTISSTK